MRVCQPRPPARKWSMTSGDSRMVVDTFGRAFGGLPRLTGAFANRPGHPPVERSGAVSGSKPGAIESSFSFIGFLLMLPFGSRSAQLMLLQQMNLPAPDRMRG